MTFLHELSLVRLLFDHVIEKVCNEVLNFLLSMRLKLENEAQIRV